MEECIFCKIVAGEIPATIVRETDDVIAFEDLHPQAPHHVLVIPRRHIATLNDLAAEDAVTVGNMARVAAEVAAERGFAEAGYRTVMNCNQQGGQTVYHIHMHLLGGRPLGWPPG